VCADYTRSAAAAVAGVPGRAYWSVGVVGSRIVSYLVALLALLLVLMARAATRAPARNRPLWVNALVGSELAGPLLALSLTLAVGVMAREWAGGPAGAAAAVLLLGAAVGFAIALARGLLTRPVIDASVVSMTGRSHAVTSGAVGAVLPVAITPRSVRLEVIRYGDHDRHLMDRHSGPEAGRRPALVFVHGGGWWRGRRSTQGRPMRYLMARSGWEVFAPSYRLSPEVGFPQHVVDVKRAIAWIRDHADELGVDPAFVAVAGGSTGGNIAALVALTAGDASLQPGFEEADTSVQACVPLYGVHDLLRPSGEPLWGYLADSVMKVAPSEDPEAWRRASPARSVTADRPPFFVIHGAADTLVWPVLSRRLVGALEAAGGPVVEYLEVPWATHGFDFFAGPRGRMTADAVRIVLDGMYARHVAGGE
jgi:acetyl esterase/lipase